MNICLRLLLRRTLLSPLTSQKTCSLPHYSSLTVTRLSRGEKGDCLFVIDPEFVNIHLKSINSLITFFSSIPFFSVFHVLHLYALSETSFIPLSLLVLLLWHLTWVGINWQIFKKTVLLCVMCDRSQGQDCWSLSFFYLAFNVQQCFQVWFTFQTSPFLWLIQFLK